jgi:Fe2+ transport system protein FeoA
MTLHELEYKRRARVVGFDGLDERETLRLDGLGLREGAMIEKLLRLPLRDPVECLLGPQLITLDAELLARILISPEP